MYSSGRIVFYRHKRIINTSLKINAIYIVGESHDDPECKEFKNVLYEKSKTEKIIFASGRSEINALWLLSLILQQRDLLTIEKVAKSLQLCYPELIYNRLLSKLTSFVFYRRQKFDQGPHVPYVHWGLSQIFSLIKTKILGFERSLI